MSYEKPVWEMIKEAIDYLDGKASYTDIKNYIKSKYGNVNDSTMTCQIIVCTVNHATRIHYPENKKPRIANTKYDYLYTTGRGQVEKYDPQMHGVWEIRVEQDGKLTVGLVQSYEATEETHADSCGIARTQDASSLLFPLESHLRDFIAQNIGTMKINNKTLQLFVDDYGTDGVEFRTDVGPIDILAVDGDGNYVVFELKVSRGSDSALGQILRYMGWIKKHKAFNKEVTGVIVAKNVDDKLKYAVSLVPNITLFEYEIDFKIQQIEL